MWRWKDEPLFLLQLVEGLNAPSDLQAATWALVNPRFPRTSLARELRLSASLCFTACSSWDWFSGAERVQGIWF